MSIFRWLFGPNSLFGKLFKRRKPTPPQPEPPKLHDIYLTVADEQGSALPNASVRLDNFDEDYTGTTDANGGLVFRNIPEALDQSHIWITCPLYLEFEQHLDLGPGEQHFQFVLKRKFVARAGRVRGEGRLWKDDDGYFFPLGNTLFWALRGWKYERDRLKQNMQFLAEHMWDYIRILGEVGWPGNSILPDEWQDYEQLLGEVIDCAYDEYGLRTQLTIVGGGSNTDYVKLASRVVNVVRSRQEKLHSIEISNEFQIKDQGKADRMMVILKGQLPRVLVAFTDAPNAGLPEVEGTESYLKKGATFGTLHLQRDSRPADGVWRTVRQSWDFKGIGELLDHNEPIGPGSSVAQTKDPLILAMLRAVGIMNGLGSFVLHNAAGIFGQPNTNHSGGYRPANLWEMENIEPIMKAVAEVEQYLPHDIANWQHFNHHWDGHPLVPDNIWSDTGEGVDKSHGVVRAYAVRKGNEFIVMPIGIKEYVEMKAAFNCIFDICDPITHKKTTKTLKAGESFRLEPKTRAKDDRGDCGAFIIKGKIL